MIKAIERFVSARKFVYATTLLAFGLGAHNLAVESIWIDEAATIHTALADPGDIIPVMLETGEYHPPLHYFLWHFWIKLTGRSELALRLLAVFFGLGATLLTYKLGRLLFDAPVGVLGALLMAFSGFHVTFSQTVRVYILLEMTAMLSCYWFARWMGRPTRANSFGYIVCGALLMYTHAFGFFVLLAQNAYFVFQTWRDSSRIDPRFMRNKVVAWMALQAALFALFALWLPVILFLARQVGDVIPPVSLADVLGTFIEFTWSSVGFVIALTILMVGGYVLIRRVVVHLSSTGRETTRAGVGYKTGGRIDGALLIAMLLFGTWGFPAILSYLVRPMYLSRYVISALPPFYLLIAWIATRVLQPGLGWSLAGLLLAAQSGGVLSLYQGVNNEQWREATQYIDSNAESGDLVLFYAGFGQYSFDYYSGRHDLTEAQLGVADGPTTANEVLSARLDQPSVWLVLVYRDEAPFKTLMPEHGYTLADEKDFFRIKLLKYEKISP